MSFSLESHALPPEALALRERVRGFLDEAGRHWTLADRARSWTAFDRAFSRALLGRVGSA